MKCQRTSDCPKDQTCLGGRCRATCKTDVDCGKGEFCNKSSEICQAVGETPTDPDGGNTDKGPSPDNTPATCGNGKLDPGETCDGTNLLGQTCKGLGFAGGTLLCTRCQIDSSSCSNDPNCGNGKLDPGETCDDSAQKKTCLDLGFTGGELVCRGCQIDTSGCTNKSPNCGNNKRDPDEDCEGTDLNSKTCETQGFLSGTLACNADCKFDTSGCAKAGEKKFGDRCKFQEECKSLICTRFNPTQDEFGYCGSRCDTETCPAEPAGATCAFTVGTFKLCGWKCTQGGNECPTGLSCLSYQGGNFCGAGKAPTGPTCGDNKAEGTEACDGTDLKGKSCKDFSFTGGTLTCKSCAFDTSQCTGGSGKKGYGEPCDSPGDCDDTGGFTCLTIQGATKGFCSFPCDTGVPCPDTPANSACILQTNQGKFCGWLCSPGTVPCPGSLKCIQISSSHVCSGG